jgi:hypothetical protein
MRQRTISSRLTRTAKLAHRSSTVPAGLHFFAFGTSVQLAIMSLAPDTYFKSQLNSIEFGAAIREWRIAGKFYLGYTTTLASLGVLDR